MHSINHFCGKARSSVVGECVKQSLQADDKGLGAGGGKERWLYASLYLAMPTPPLSL